MERAAEVAKVCKTYGGGVEIIRADVSSDRSVISLGSRPSTKGCLHF